MENEAEGIAGAIVPYFPDDHRKSKYLSFRTTGFPFREACKLANISISTVRNWRASDEEFAKLLHNLKPLQTLLKPALLNWKAGLNTNPTN